MKHIVSITREFPTELMVSENKDQPKDINKDERNSCERTDLQTQNQNTKKPLAQMTAFYRKNNLCPVCSVQKPFLPQIKPVASSVIARHPGHPATSQVGLIR